jgi:hypothetical protein
MCGPADFPALQTSLLRLFLVMATTGALRLSLPLLLSLLAELSRREEVEGGCTRLGAFESDTLTLG